MTNNKIPFCSVIVLNYFGERMIKQVIESLERMDFPKEKLEIIVVDNNSEDKSIKILKQLSRKFKNIKLVLSSENLGFSKGNNLGIEKAKGKYVTLLNNDCVVEKNWLKELIKTAESDQKIFAVNSKIKLYPRYIKLTLKSASPLLISECKLVNSNLCKLTQSTKINIEVENKKKLYFLKIPYDFIKDRNLKIILNLENFFTRNRVLNLVGIPKDKYIITSRRIKKIEQIYTIHLPLSDQITDKFSYDLIQNAGIVVFQNGAGRDIGAIVKYNEQTYEPDIGQYDKERETYAACAAASLYRMDIFKKLGNLDDSYFMYYEDVDISERARMMGYKVIYQPKAEVRHMHALSSEEWSAFFVYNAEKGRFLHLLHNFPLEVFIKEYFIFIFKIIENAIKISITGKIFKLLASMFSGREDKERDYKSVIKMSQYIKYLRVAAFLFINFPILIVRRYTKNYNLPNNAIKKNYQSILNGEWYL